MAKTKVYRQLLIHIWSSYTVRHHHQRVKQGKRPVDDHYQKTDKLDCHHLWICTIRSRRCQYRRGAHLSRWARSTSNKMISKNLEYHFYCQTNLSINIRCRLQDLQGVRYSRLLKVPKIVAQADTTSRLHSISYRVMQNNKSFIKENKVLKG